MAQAWQKACQKRGKEKLASDHCTGQTLKRVGMTCWSGIGSGDLHPVEPCINCCQSLSIDLSAELLADRHKGMTLVDTSMCTIELTVQ
jgi:hypothetical protein